MKDLIKKQYFICKDNYCVDAIIGLLVFGILVGVSVIFGTVYGVCVNDMQFIPDGLGLLLGFLSTSVGIITFSAYTVYKNKTCIFTIDNSKITLKGKRRGENVNIERNHEDIKSIVIKTFNRSSTIVLVDTIGELGYYAASRNGQFIKIAYSKKRLNAIKSYLPNCPIIYSENANMGELL